MMMLKKFLFTMVLVVGCSLMAFGQSDGKKQDPPPKKDPPTVKLPDKKDPPKPTPTPTPKKPNLIEASLEAKVAVVG